MLRCTYVCLAFPCQSCNPLRVSYFCEDSSSCIIEGRACHRSLSTAPHRMLYCICVAGGIATYGSEGAMHACIAARIFCCRWPCTCGKRVCDLIWFACDF